MELRLVLRSSSISKILTIFAAMAKILCIDTATDVCTVSIFENEKCLCAKESGEERSHAVQLAVYIDEALKETGLSVSDLDAIAVSMGPGSYTGLRIGVSTAKGLCYGANVPLIAVSTLESMCYGIADSELNDVDDNQYYFCPMLDARRMEVYTALYTSKISEHKGISAEIIDGNSFQDILETRKIVFFGNGAAKTKEHIKSDNAIFKDGFLHSSKNMIKIALQKLKNNQFEDVAYFEPFYLKDFIATTPKKNIFG